MANTALNIYTRNEADLFILETVNHCKSCGAALEELIRRALTTADWDPVDEGKFVVYFSKTDWRSSGLGGFASRDKLISMGYIIRHKGYNVPGAPGLGICDSFEIKAEIVIEYVLVVVQAAPSRETNRRKHTRDKNRNSFYRTPDSPAQDLLNWYTGKKCPVDWDRLLPAFIERVDRWRSGDLVRDLTATLPYWTKAVFSISRTLVREPDGTFVYCPELQGSTAGRIFEIQGGGLQGCLREIKSIALDSMAERNVFSYDLTSCHVNVLHVVVTELNKILPMSHSIDDRWLSAYLEDESRTLLEAAQHGIDRKTWKKILFCAIMGGRGGATNKNTIFKLCSENLRNYKAIQHLIDPLIQMIRDFEHVVSTLIKNVRDGQIGSFIPGYTGSFELAGLIFISKNGKGTYIRNAAQAKPLYVYDKGGKRMPKQVGAKKRLSAGQITSYLLTGGEVAIINALAQAGINHGYTAVHPQHDGFVTVGLITKKAIDEARNKLPIFSKAINLKIEVYGGSDAVSDAHNLAHNRLTEGGWSAWKEQIRDSRLNAPVFFAALEDVVQQEDELLSVDVINGTVSSLGYLDGALDPVLSPNDAIGPREMLLPSDHTTISTTWFTKPDDHTPHDHTPHLAHSKELASEDIVERHQTAHESGRIDSKFPISSLEENAQKRQTPVSQDASDAKVQFDKSLSNTTSLSKMASDSEMNSKSLGATLEEDKGNSETAKTYTEIYYHYGLTPHERYGNQKQQGGSVPVLFIDGLAKELGCDPKRVLKFLAGASKAIHGNLTWPSRLADDSPGIVKVREKAMHWIRDEDQINYNTMLCQAEQELDKRLLFKRIDLCGVPVKQWLFQIPRRLSPSLQDKVVQLVDDSAGQCPFVGSYGPDHIEQLKQLWKSQPDPKLENLVLSHYRKRLRRHFNLFDRLRNRSQK